MKVNQVSFVLVNFLMILIKTMFSGGKLKPFKPLLTTTASWEPTNGLIVHDAVFPHIQFGFRNRKIPVATYHVCYSFLVFYRFSTENCLIN